MRYVYICLILGVASICDAQLVLQPEGLEPGDQYRLIFTTSQKRDATSSNIEDYNNFVQSVADSSPEVASWGLEWKAIASTPTVDAVTNTGTDWQVEDGVPIYRVDGALAYEDNHDLWVLGLFDSPNTVFLDLDEMGRTIPPENDRVTVFTGTNSTGVRAPIGIPIENRGLGGAPFANIGYARETFPRFRFGIDTAPIGAQNHLYALSGIIAAVPEPRTGDLLLPIASAAAIGIRRRREPIV